MSYYSSKDQAPQPSGWSHRTDFWARQANLGAGRWPWLPEPQGKTSLHYPHVEQPSTDNALSRFIISSDPFAKQTQLPCPSPETGLVWEQSLNCSRAAWGTLWQARQDTTALFTLFLGGRKRNLERVCNGLGAGFANQFHNECISLWSPLLARNKIEAVFCFAEISTFKTCSGFIISARDCTSFLIHGCKIQRDRTAQKITAKM